MGQPEVTNDAITLHLKNLLESNSEALRATWKEFMAEPGNPELGKDFYVYKQLQMQIGNTPCIELIAKDKTTNIFSIGTQEDIYNYDIIISVMNSHPEESAPFLRIVANAVMDLLNAFSNRSFTVPGYSFCAYYSEAPTLDYGFRRGHGLLSGRISWSCKILKSNRGV